MEGERGGVIVTAHSVWNRVLSLPSTDNVLLKELLNDVPNVGHIHLQRGCLP